MMSPEWKHVETVQKRVRIQKVNSKNREIEAFDLELGCTLSFNVDPQVNLDKVKRAKIYQATVKVYKAEFTVELERQMVESALGNPEELKRIKAMKAAGSKPTRFDLTELKH
jgi:FKBP-type peptidyl-prolyl cis-trans isomerase (trigger factor)